jgi:hypothetical protein
VNAAETELCGTNKPPPLIIVTTCTPKAAAASTVKLPDRMPLVSVVQVAGPPPLKKGDGITDVGVGTPVQVLLTPNPEPDIVTTVPVPPLLGVRVNVAVRRKLASEVSPVLPVALMV